MKITLDASIKEHREIAELVDSEDYLKSVGVEVEE